MSNLNEFSEIFLQNGKNTSYIYKNKPLYT